MMNPTLPPLLKGRCLFPLPPLRTEGGEVHFHSFPCERRVGAESFFASSLPKGGGGVLFCSLPYEGRVGEDQSRGVIGPTFIMPPDRELPNAALRLLFLSAEEVIGADGMRAMLNSADMAQYVGHYPPDNLEYGATFSQYGRVEQAIEDLYGSRGARAILLRAGRRTFQYGLKEQPAAFGLAREGPESMPGVSKEAKMGRLLRQMVDDGERDDETASMPGRRRG